MATVELAGVRKAFGPVDVIRDLDLIIRDRELTVLVGPSGCGKSTLLRLIAGLEPVSAGRIAIAGEDVTRAPPGTRGVAMVFQSYALYPHMTVAENIGFGLRLARTPRDEVARRVAQAAGILQIEKLLDRRPRQLSGGQRQRVAIGRAIVREPLVFLFDEPLSNLDAALRGRMRFEIAKLKADLDATIVYVTHDQHEAMTLADQVVVMRDGVIEQAGAPLDLYRAPANRFVAGFIGSPRMNFVPVTLSAGAAGTEARATPDGPPLALAGRPAATEAVLGFRPEHATASSPGSFLDGEVTVVEHLGNETHAYVSAGLAEPVVLRLPADHPARRGDVIGIAPAPAACHLFGADGMALRG
jgi:multiple sugar transport system ATP-binding protein